MSTSTIIWIVIAILVVGGGIWYYMTYMQGNTSTSPAATQGQQATSSNDGSAGNPSVNMGVQGSVNQGNMGGSQQ